MSINQNNPVEAVKNTIKKSGLYDKFKRQCGEQAISSEGFKETEQQVRLMINDRLHYDCPDVKTLRQELVADESIRSSIDRLVNEAVSEERINQLFYPTVLQAAYDILGMVPPEPSDNNNVDMETSTAVDVQQSDEQVIQVDEGADLQVTEDNVAEVEMEMSSDSDKSDNDQKTENDTEQSLVESMQQSSADSSTDSTNQCEKKNSPEEVAQTNFKNQSPTISIEPQLNKDEVPTETNTLAQPDADNITEAVVQLQPSDCDSPNVEQSSEEAEDSDNRPSRPRRTRPKAHGRHKDFVYY